MGAVNRAQLRNLARLYADGRPGGANSFIADSNSSANAVSMDTIVNGCIAEWYDAMISARGHEWFETESTLAIVANTATYTLPADFYQLLSARLDWGTNQVEELEQTPVRDRTWFANISTGWARWSPKAYRLRGTQAAGMRTFELFPTPASAVTCTIRYIPICSLLVDDTTTFDDANNYSELVALKAAIKYRTIAEKPIGNLEQLYNECAARLSALAGQRNANIAETIGQASPEFKSRREWLGDRRWI
jgi:hypothetical protein